MLIVILNWNELKFTYQCVSSLIHQMEDNDDILVIDNDSVIDPTDFLKAKFPKIKIIRNVENLGVAGGRNVGVGYAIQNNYEYVFFIDNDAYADSKLLKSLLNAAEQCSSTGLFGPKIYLNNDFNIIWRAGCTSWRWTYLHAGFAILNRFCRLLKKRPPAWIDTGRGENQKDIGQYDQVKDVSFQIGCAQLIRTKIFKEIGFLDTEFSFYGSEDIDFCARLSRHGWKIKYVPQAICWHRSESSFSDNYKRSYYNTRNIILLARKNLHPLYFSFLFIPDFLLLTIPLVLMKNLICRQKKQLHGFLVGIAWNLQDVIKRGILLRNKLKKADKK